MSGADSGGASGAQKGLYDLGTYFGMFRLDKNAISSDVFSLVELVLALHENLSKKMETYVAPEAETMRAIFLLNNLNYLLKRLEK